MADRTMLPFDYEQAHGQVGTAMLGRSDGMAGWQDPAVVIGDRAVMLRVDANTDELVVELDAAPDEGPLCR